MVSVKFWRGKFSRPATGYEYIAHAQTFDRGVACNNFVFFELSHPSPSNHSVEVRDMSDCGYINNT